MPRATGPREADRLSQYTKGTHVKSSPTLRVSAQSSSQGVTERKRKSWGLLPPSLKKAKPQFTSRKGQLKPFQVEIYSNLQLPATSRPGELHQGEAEASWLLCRFTHWQGQHSTSFHLSLVTQATVKRLTIPKLFIIFDLGFRGWRDGSAAKSA